MSENTGWTRPKPEFTVTVRESTEKTTGYELQKLDDTVILMEYKHATPQYVRSLQYLTVEEMDRLAIGYLYHRGLTVVERGRDK